MSEFEERKAEKDGVMTPTQLARNLLAACERGEITSLIYTASQDDGEIRVGFTAGPMAKTIGLFEIGKNYALDQFMYD